MLTHTTVFDALQKEFCPPLDSSLVAALLADIDFTEPPVEDGIGKRSAVAGPSSSLSLSASTATLKPKASRKKGKKILGSADAPNPINKGPTLLERSLETLRQTLRELAAQAEVDAAQSSFGFDANGDADSLDPTSNIDRTSAGSDDRETVTTTSLFTTGTSDNVDSGNTDGRSSKRSRKYKSSNTTPSYAGTNKTSASGTTSGATTTTSSSSNTSESLVNENFHSPLGFLQAALPHIPTKRLRKALKEAEEASAAKRLVAPIDSEDIDNTDDSRSSAFSEDASADDNESELDMWDIIASILTAESIREMEERGFEGLIRDEDEELARLLAEEEGEWPEDRIFKDREEEWVKVGSKADKKKVVQKVGKRESKKDKTVKITLNDIRQQGSAVRTKSKNGESDFSATMKLPPPDRWTQVVSLSSLLSTLFPSYPTTFFQSFFHSPNYPDSYEACCAVLQKIASATTVLGVSELEEAERQKEKEKKLNGNGDGALPNGNKKELPLENHRHVPPGRKKGRVRTVTDGHHHPPLKPPAEGWEGGEGQRQVVGEGKSGAGDENHEIDDEKHSTRETALLFNLLDILLPQYGLDPGGPNSYSSDLLSDSDQEELERTRTQVILEIQLAVRATKGREDDTLDVVKLLRELDEERKERFPELMEEFYKNGVVAIGNGSEGRVKTRRDGLSYAALVGASSSGVRRGNSTSVLVNDASVVGTASSSSSGTTSTVVQSTSKPASAVKGKQKPSPYQWQAVPVRKAPEKPAYVILPHLPTYTRDVNGIKRRGKDIDPSYVWTSGVALLSDQHLHSNSVPGSSAGPLRGRSTYKSEAEAAELDYRKRIGENMRRRDELLREAARMWSRGVGGHGAKLVGGDKTKAGRGGAGVGGEVAWYFAERAREFQEMARKESLNAARTMVHRKRMASNDKNAIDLHGTTVSEAVAIVEEVLAEQPTSQARPLKIITGRGSHSVNQTSVLKPALKKRLVEDGWVVGTWDAGLIVRGRR